LGNPICIGTVYYRNQYIFVNARNPVSVQKTENQKFLQGIQISQTTLCLP